MPIFMDRHDIKGVTAEEVAKVHQEDLKVQHHFNCRAMTYWFDKERGTAFCLVEAPDKQAVEKMHRHSHGLLPNQVIEVDKKLVESFLGRIEDPVSDGEKTPTLKIFEDSGFRVMVAVGFKNIPRLQSKLGFAKCNLLIKEARAIIREVHSLYLNDSIKTDREGSIATFTSVTTAIECALEVLKRLRNPENNPNGAEIPVGIGLSSGEPVTEHDSLFGEAILSTRRLSYIADNGEVLLSTEVGKQYALQKPDKWSKWLKKLGEGEEHFLNQLMETTERNWDQDRFTVADYCRHMGISRSRLYRKIKLLVHQTPNQFLKEFRLKKAAEQLVEHPENITKVAFESGFRNPSYFSKCFKIQYGVLPSEYIRGIV